MLKHLFFYISLAICFLGFSQKGKQPHHHKSEEITKGDQYFNNGDYFLAVQYYQKALETFSGDPYVHHQLAESQRLIYDYKAAEPNYKAVVDYIDKNFSKNHHHEDYPLVRFRYATTLKANEKCDLAKEQFELFINHFKKDATLDDKQYHERALLEYNGCTFLDGQKDKVLRNYGFEILPEPVNGNTSDYAPAVFVNDTTISATSTRGGDKTKKIYNTTGQKFSDVLMFKKEGDAWKDISQDQSFDKINEALNDGAGCFNATKDKYYFTKCDVLHAESNGECNIYYTKLEKFKWTQPKPLNNNVNMKGYWSGQPALSGKGDTLFFVSKRPKGKGNHDIWYCTKKGEGETWGPAINLTHLNTPFSEVSPFFDAATKNLYFSSNGLEGMGELDIFRTVDSTFKEAQNIGVPFNSTKDDFYYVLGQKYGYLASNREGMGSDDIYKFNVVSFEDIIAEIPKDSIAEANSIAVNGKLMLADKTTPAANISVLIKDSAGNVIRKMNTDDDGRFRFESMEGKKYYKVVLEKKRTDILADVEYTVKDYKLKKSEKEASKATFEHVFFNFDDYKLRPEGKIVLDKLFDIIQKHPNLQIELGAYTDNFGPTDYNLKLSELRSKEAFNYLKAKGIDKTALVQGFGEDSPLASNDNPIGRQLNRRLDFGIIGADTIKSFGQVYISTIDQTVDQVAKEFKVPAEELKKMNGLGNDTKLETFRPVRLPSDGTHIISETTIHMANSTDYNKYNKQYDNANVAALEHKGTITVDGDSTYYVVAKGNTVYSISKFFRMKPEELIQINELDGFGIKLGQRLRVIDNREKDD